MPICDDCHSRYRRVDIFKWACYFMVACGIVAALMLLYILGMDIIGHGECR